jgi:hypothetical protein
MDISLSGWLGTIWQFLFEQTKPRRLKVRVAARQDRVLRSQKFVRLRSRMPVFGGVKRRENRSLLAQPSPHFFTCDFNAVERNAK